MPTELEYALDHVGGTDFERLAPEFLKDIGYEVKTSGEHGKDGGWDALVELDNVSGVAHASVRDDWKRKLREDAESTEELEERLDEDFGIFVFLTNKQPSGEQELSLREEIRDEYGWELTVLHRRDLLSTLRTESPEIADRHLGVNPQTRSDNLEIIKDIQTDRIEKIRERKGAVAELEEGPVVVYHLLPNGMTSKSYVDSAGELPDPPLLDDRYRGRIESIGDGKYIVRGEAGIDPQSEFSLLKVDGLLEMVSSEFFHEKSDSDGKFITNRGDSKSLDTRSVKSVKNGIEKLREVGVSGPVFLFISVLAEEGLLMSIPYHIDPPRQGFRGFTTSEYTTSPVAIEDSRDITKKLSEPLNELWREAGRSEGSPHFENGEWIGPDV
ncbi:hypothetical protein [Natronoglomus mannanivorans]|uniref:Restriction endonuclease n=1 Tax=Natronoglomus mannanivorans TaxID=2979990 RepID=A0AAP2Z4C2_9EURY|nr:hypothetical protein [Halobacteria archaeon AArc-xg1-1]